MIDSHRLIAILVLIIFGLVIFCIYRNFVDGTQRRAEDQVRSAQEEQRRRGYEEQARRVAEDQVRSAQEEQRRRDSEEQARRVAEDQVRSAAARDAANEAAQNAAEFARRAAVESFERQQNLERQQQAAKRAESAQRAKRYKAEKISQLGPWREYFVKIVAEIGRPVFSKWHLDGAQLSLWADKRADVYIEKKPYVLEIIQSLHADAENAAESLANVATKSNREIARDRTSRNAPNFNPECPYCGIKLDQKAHLDHIHPVQRGGPSEPWNLVYVCVQCNRAKRDLSLMEFAETDYARSRKISLKEIVSNLKILEKNVNVMQ